MRFVCPLYLRGVVGFTLWHKRTRSGRPMDRKGSFGSGCSCGGV